MPEERKTIFRQESMNKVSSPEQLNEYVKVSTPSIWIILGGILVLLIGACVWGIFGHLDTVLQVATVSSDEGVYCYIKGDDVADVQAGMEVTVNGETATISEIQVQPIEVNEQMDSYATYVGDLVVGEWVYVATIDAALADGIYEGEIIIDSVSPISFITN